MSTLSVGVDMRYLALLVLVAGCGNPDVTAWADRDFASSDIARADDMTLVDFAHDDLASADMANAVTVDLSHPPADMTEPDMAMCLKTSSECVSQSQCCEPLAGCQVIPGTSTSACCVGMGGTTCSNLTARRCCNTVPVGTYVGAQLECVDYPSVGVSNTCCIRVVADCTLPGDMGAKEIRIRCQETGGYVRVGNCF